MPESADPRLQELIDREAIRDLVHRYCRAVDRRDLETLRSLYHDDAVDEHGGMFNGPAQEFVERLPEIMAPMEILWHSVTNLLIEVRGDEAEGEVYTLAYHRADLGDGPVDMIVGGRYLDRYTRRDGVWRFQHRRIVLDWNRVEPSLCDRDSELFAGTPKGTVGDADPACTFFRWLGRDPGA